MITIENTLYLKNLPNEVSHDLLLSYLNIFQNPIPHSAISKLFTDLKIKFSLHPYTFSIGTRGQLKI